MRPAACSGRRCARPHPHRRALRPRRRPRLRRGRRLERLPRPHAGRAARRQRAREPRSRAHRDPQLGLRLSAHAHHREPRARRRAQGRRRLRSADRARHPGRGRRRADAQPRRRASSSASCRSTAASSRRAACCRRWSRRARAGLRRVHPADRQRRRSGDRARRRDRRGRHARRRRDGVARSGGRRRRGRPPTRSRRRRTPTPPDLADVDGQPLARRALEIAAAGGHHLLLVAVRPAAARRCWRGGCPACCPSSTSTRRSRSPPSTRSRACSRRAPGWSASRPFRAPHHTISDAALVGGGSQPRPGEISLAHHGVLFLDEMPEFTPARARSAAPAARRRRGLDRPRGADRALPCPLPAGRGDEPVSLRLRRPPAARVPLHAAGRCSSYAARLSGPLRDRIDLSADLPAVPLAALTFERQRRGDDGAGPGARRRRPERQAARYARAASGSGCNGALAGRDIRRHAALDAARRGASSTQAAERLGLSARAHDRVLRVARTIADLAESRRRDR